MTDQNDEHMRALPALRAPTSPAQGFGETLMEILADKNIPADKLQIVLQMQREILADRRREAFTTAFVSMSAELPQVIKHGLVQLKTRDGKDLGRYAFARWEDMDDIVRPVLNKHGFAVSFAEEPSGTKGMVILTGELMHVDGHSKLARRQAPADFGPGRNELQAEGSAISYCKRYLFEELTNTVRRGEDDDAASVTDRKIGPEQIEQIRQLLEQTRTDLNYFLHLMLTDISELEDIPERDFDRLITALEGKKRKGAAA